ncbi:MAG: FkbM family methyltransferase [Magnetococcales bacterium]|nr:FkbM family methyltransferase [Magnetococcales bacterium]
MANKNRVKPSTAKQSVLTIDGAFAQAIKHLNAGEYSEVDKLCTAIIDKVPNHINAINLLGVIAQRVNRHDLAVVQFQRAIDVDGSIAMLYFNLGTSLYPLGEKERAVEVMKIALEKDPGNIQITEYLQGILNNSGKTDSDLQQGLAFHQSGQFDAAIKCYKKSLESNPDEVVAMNNLGSALLSLGELGEAIEYYQRAVAIKPGYVEALGNLGAALKDQGKLDSSVEYLQKAIAIKPEFVEALGNLGSVLQIQGKLDKAIDCFQKAVAIKPERAEALTNLGVALKEQGRLEKALDCYQKAIDIDASYIEAHANLGVALQEQGKLDLAVESYKKVLVINPNHSEARYNLGLALQKLGNLDGAIASLEKVISLRPDFAKAYNALGVSLKNQGRLGEAITRLEKAISINPDYADAFNTLGNTLKEQAKLDEACQSYKKAIAIRPDYAEAYSNLAGTRSDQGDQEQAIINYQKAITINPGFVDAHSNLLFTMQYGGYSPQELFHEHKLWDSYHTSHFQYLSYNHEKSQEPGKRLKIGFVSGDFCKHSVSYFLEPLFKASSKDLQEFYCYSNSHIEDEVTLRLKGMVEGWRKIAGKDDQTVVEIIFADGIDILFDLSGHTKWNRLPVFARKPAPVQVTWLGYPDTTGLRAMDYRLSDEVADPSRQSELYGSEQLIRMPNGFLCYQPPEDAPDVTPLPMTANGYVTFGSLNKLIKITPEVVKAWSKILHMVPGSKLLVKSKALACPGVRKRYLSLFENESISSDRLILLQATSKIRDHLAKYGQIDIGLDSFPYNGTTTTCEALWMGVPVVALNGERHAARVSASLLTQIGLEQLIAADVNGYIDKAVKLASDHKTITELRSGLRKRMQESPLCDAKLFAEDMESILRKMWHDWCRYGQANSDKALKSQGMDVVIKGGVRVCVPDNLSLITPYVLLEQEDWFESEVGFVRELVQPGMTVLDIGANYGIYTLVMAQALKKNGVVFAFEPTRSTGDFLEKSLELNGFETVKLIRAAVSNCEEESQLYHSQNSELNSLTFQPGMLSVNVNTRSLDGCMEEFGWEDVAFIKLDAEGEEANVLKGGEKLLSSQSPLLQFEVKHGEGSNFDLVEKLTRFGYKSYRFVPGLGCLIPFVSSEDIDGFQLNLFACKEERAVALAGRNLLVLSADNSGKLGSTGSGGWPSELLQLPFAQAHNWDSPDSSSAKEYAQALQDYFTAQQKNQSAGQRLAFLKKSLTGLQHAVAAKASYPRLCSLARAFLEFGYRSKAIDSLEKIEKLLSQGAINSREPFLPVAKRFETISPGNNLEDWYYVSAVEAYERSLSFSSYFDGAKHQPILTKLKERTFQSPETDRRLQLIRLRSRQQKCPEKIQTTGTLEATTLNPDFWGE